MNEEQDGAEVQPVDSATGDPIVVIRRKGEFIFGWIVAACLLMGILSILLIWRPPNTSFVYNVQVLVSVWLALWAAWLVGAHPKLVVWAWGLEVTNWFFRYRIPWGAVRWIQATDDVVIHLVDGGKVKPAVAAFSVFSAKRGSRLQSGVREQVEQARKAAAADRAVDTAVVRRLDVYPVPFLGLLAGLVLLAYLTSGVL